MKFEDNIDKILIISLGENKNLWKHIDKIYYENEVKYFEAYLNERDKYKKEKSRYPAKVEEYIKTNSFMPTISQILNQPKMSNCRCSEQRDYSDFDFNKLYANKI